MDKIYDFLIWRARSLTTWLSSPRWSAGHGKSSPEGRKDKKNPRKKKSHPTKPTQIVYIWELYFNRTNYTPRDQDQVVVGAGRPWPLGGGGARCSRPSFMDSAVWFAAATAGVGAREKSIPTSDGVVNPWTLRDLESCVSVVSTLEFGVLRCARWSNFFI